MIGKALRMDIEAYAGQIDRNPLFAATLAGRMTRSMVTKYLVGLHYILLQTPPFLVRAGERARELGNERLAEFYFKRVTEEIGHDAWAENDLKRLQAKPLPREDVLETARAMIDQNAAFIEKDPALWLSYIAFCEYFTVMKAPEWLVLLEERCGIPRSGMTAVGNHVELDRDHAEEVFELIDELITDPKMLAPMREALKEAIERFDAYCAEVVTPIAESSSINVTVADTPHVSAA